MLDNLRWRRALGMKCQLEVADDPIDNFVVFNVSIQPLPKRLIERIRR